MKISLSQPIEIQGNFDDEKSEVPTFYATALTAQGQPIRPAGWSRREGLVIDIAGVDVETNNPQPVNFAHGDDNALVGHGIASKTPEAAIRVDGVFSVDGAETTRVVTSAERGFRWRASIEATLGQIEYIKAGQTGIANGGQEYPGPVSIARTSEMTGLAILSKPADRATSVSVFSEENPDVAKSTALVDADGKPLAAEATQQDGTQTTQQTEQATTKVAATETTEPVEISAADQHVLDIRAAAATETKRLTMIDTHCGSEFPEIKAKAIEEGWEEHQVELAVVKAKHAKLEEIRGERSTGPAIHSSNSEELQDVNVFAAAVHQSMEPTIRDSDFVADAYGEKQAELSKRLPVNAGLHYLCFSVIRAAGGYVEAGTGFTNDHWNQVILAERQIKASSSFSTISVSDTLSNVANKQLLRIYRDFPSMVPVICSPTTHTDFKEHDKIRLDGDLDFRQLAATGEIEHGSLSDQKYTNRVYQWARMLSISRPDIINDDLSAFSRNSTLLARGAMRGREKALFSTLLNPANVGTFFKTAAVAGANAGTGENQVNHITGGSLDAAGLEAAETLIHRMRDSSGDPVMITPEALLTGTALKTRAENLLVRRTTSVVDQNQASPNERRELRVEDSYLGKFRPECSPYIDAGVPIAGTGDNFYFLLGSMDYAAIEYATLRGAGEAPMIQSADTDFNTLGLQMRGYWDFGFGLQDPRGIVRVDI